MPRRLILASASPRRRELLALLGLPFEVAPSRVDEDIDPNVGARQVLASTLSPIHRAEALAWQKAFDVWLSNSGSQEVIIAADTLVDRKSVV